MSWIRAVGLQLKMWAGRLFFLRYVPQSYLYTRKRDRIDRAEQRRRAQAQVVEIGSLQTVTATGRGGQFTFDAAELTVEFLTPDLVRCHWTPGQLPVDYAIAKPEWDAVPVHLEQTEAGYRFTCAEEVQTDRAVQVQVSFAGDVKLYHHQTLMRHDLPPERKGEDWIHQTALQPNEQIYGLGERAAPLNLRRQQDGQGNPTTYQLWNFNAAGIYFTDQDPLYLCLPVYVALHGYGSYLTFYENTHRGIANFGDPATVRFEGGALRYYLTVGTIPQLLRRYTELTGRAPLPPRWALGYQQSRWGYRSQESDLYDLAANFAAHDLPLSAIHLDIDSQVNFRAFTLDPERFPHMRQLTQVLLEQGIRLIAINNPGIKRSRESNLLLEGQILDGFCKLPNGEPVAAPVWAGWSLFPDFTHPQVRDWWTRQYAYLLDVGIAGFWHDMNEPAAFVTHGDHTLPPTTQHHLEGRGGNHIEAHNVYGFMQARAAYESLRRYRPHQRPYIISRAGWAGLQRYAWTWTGDSISNWGMLRQTLAMIIGLGLSGVPFAGSDIGGFMGNPSAELYLRWLQYSCFFGFCRTHSSIHVDDRYPWTFGEPYLSIIRHYLKLRQRLLPYLYTLAWEAHQLGYPLVRPVFWHETDNPALWGIDDAFLLGDRVLVCPVLERGSTVRSVQLPRGAWYSFWDDKRWTGGDGAIELPVSLEQIPLLIRAGSILPMQRDRQLELHLYAPETTVDASSMSSQIYDDDGDGYGASRLDTLSLERTAQGLEMHWQTEGDFPFAYDTVQIYCHGMEPRQAWVDGQEVAIAQQTIACDRFTRLSLQC